MGNAEFVKALIAANATVDKEDEWGQTALLQAVQKMENLMLEKRPPYTSKGIALLAVTRRTRYRRIPLFPPPPPSSPPMCWGCIFRPVNRCCLFGPREAARSSEA